MTSKSRRAFLSNAVTSLVAGAAAFSNGPAAAGVRAYGLDLADHAFDAGRRRQAAAYRIRVDSAKLERLRPLPAQRTNGDEGRYRNRIASYSKGLLHNYLGEVDTEAYRSLLYALGSGHPEDFEAIVIGEGARLVNPQAGLAFDLQGPDSHALAMPPAPAFAGAVAAAEIVENYWMALTRDVPFAAYEVDRLATRAASELSGLPGFRGPRSGGRATGATLFRGHTAGDLIGPYVSQFLWLDTPFGAERVDRRMRTSLAGFDYLTGYEEWLAIQNGAAAGPLRVDPHLRYIRNGRDLGEWVHADVLFQAYFNALLILLHLRAPVDPGNPYHASRTQIGFGTLGDPFIASVVCAVARRALKAVWYQKWLVHRRLRPEVFAGRIHNHVTGAARYPLHPDALASEALEEIRLRTGSALLPMAFPEGSPLHPSYGAGHATVAGACVTVLKAFFDEAFVLPHPVEATPDGLLLQPYAGHDLTVGGELNKLASNIALGRNMAGLHWRSDATDSLTLGEELAVRYLTEELTCFNEEPVKLTLTRFDGRTIAITSRPHVDRHGES